MGVIGRSCIFLFPFGIHRISAAISPRVIPFQGFTLRIYAPFANSDTQAQYPLLNNTRLPCLPDVEHPANKLIQMKIDANPGWQTPFGIADALRIDIYGDREERFLASVANDAAGHFLRLCRMWTRQWWILRGPSESTEPFRNIFAVDGQGKAISSEISETLYVSGWLGTERLLNEHEFNLVNSALHMHADPSFACMTIFDAVNAANLGDRQRSILDAAIACEALFSEQVHVLRTAQQVDASVARKVLKQDFEHRLCGGSRQIFGRTFADDEPDAWAALKRLWIARHALAHGNPDQIARNAEINDQESFLSSYRAACAFFTWMSRSRKRQFPDPMLAFDQPLIKERNPVQVRGAAAAPPQAESVGRTRQSSR